jgi:hypothetical protein
VLKLLQQERLLQHLIVAGSWCIYFYKFYYNKRQSIATLRTRDVDFFIPSPKTIKIEVDLPELLGSLGFITDFQGRAGYIRFVHPGLFIEFLVTEKGRPVDKPYPLKQLKINAQALRFLEILQLKTVSVKVEDFELTLPHPSCFVLHKIIVYKRRPKRDKRTRDVEQIIRVLNFMQKQNELDSLLEVYSRLHNKWQNKIISNLKEIGQVDIAEFLERPKKKSQ